MDMNYVLPIKANKTHVTDLLKRYQPTWSISTTDPRIFRYSKADNEDLTAKEILRNYGNVDLFKSEIQHEVNRHKVNSHRRAYHLRQ